MPRFFRAILVERRVCHAAYELVIMRVLFALVVYDSINWSRTFLGQPKPNGAARLFDLRLFGRAEMLDSLQWLIWLPLAVYAAGYLPALAILSLLVVTVGRGALNNSQGAIDHSVQIVSLILVAQLVCHIVDGIRQSKAGRRRAWLAPEPPQFNLAVHFSKVTLAAGYVVSGVTKLLHSDFLWIAKAPLLAVQILKANLRDYSDTLERQTDFFSSRVPQLIVEFPNLARAFFGCGLVLELVCFLALRGRRWAFATGGSLILMHLLISRIMALDFWIHVFCVAIFFVNLPGIPQMLRERNAPTPMRP